MTAAMPALYVGADTPLAADGAAMMAAIIM